MFAVEMNYLRGACGVTRWEGESSAGVYESCNIGACEVVWSSGMGEKEIIEVVWPYWEDEEFVKKVYVSEIEGPSRKGRPLGRWKDKVKEYVYV